MTKARMVEIKKLLEESDFVCDPDACREVILELLEEVIVT